MTSARRQSHRRRRRPRFHDLGRDVDCLASGPIVARVTRPVHRRLRNVDTLAGVVGVGAQRDLLPDQAGIVVRKTELVRVWLRDGDRSAAIGDL